MKLAAHPGLYEPDVDVPRLDGGRCDACGATTFPPIPVGCEVCGAPESSLKRVSLAAEGVVHSVATVHLHLGDDIKAPFTIAEIVLDGGPLIRATMTEVADNDAIGARVAARFVTVGTTSESHDVVEPRFELVTP